MEGSDKFSQSYDHYKILCKLASGHALRCLSDHLQALSARHPRFVGTVLATFGHGTSYSYDSKCFLRVRTVPIFHLYPFYTIYTVNRNGGKNKNCDSHILRSKCTVHRQRLKDKISHHIKKKDETRTKAQNLQGWEFHSSAHDYSNVSVTLFDQVSIRSHRP